MAFSSLLSSPSPSINASRSSSFILGSRGSAIPLSTVFSAQLPISVAKRISCRISATSSGNSLMDPASPKMKVDYSSDLGLKKGSAIVDVDLGNRSYPIYIGSGLLDQPNLLQRTPTNQFGAWTSLDVIGMRRSYHE